VTGGTWAPGCLDVVIVNWNTGEYLRSCLASLGAAASSADLGRVVVVDNASTDGSSDALPAHPPVTVLHNTANVGFAAGCNQGARLGSAPYVLFLNPDTVLAADALGAAVEFMASESGAPYGVCGGLVLGRDGSPTYSASRFPTLANVTAGVLRLDRFLAGGSRHLRPAELHASGPVDQVIGAFFLVRRPLFERLGGFDERYFLYYEEVDFCLRARDLGWPAYFLRDARVTHVGNVSARGSGGAALYHSLRSRTLYAFRHWGRAPAWALVCLTVAVELPARMARATVTRSRPELTSTARAARSYLGFLRTRAGGLP
jgi:N-acetylglucosaminyl-diphospho-decaprenol L-rhamnosyltransferase